MSDQSQQGDTPPDDEGEQNEGRANKDRHMETRVTKLEQSSMQTAERLAAIEQTVAVIQASMATKADLANLRTEFKTELGELRTGFKTELGELRTGFKTELGELRIEFKTEIGALRTELREDVAVLRGAQRADTAELGADMKVLHAQLETRLSQGLQGQTWKMITSSALLVMATSFVTRYSVPVPVPAPSPVAATAAPVAAAAAPIVIQGPPTSSVGSAVGVAPAPGASHP